MADYANQLVQEKSVPFRDAYKWAISQHLEGKVDLVKNINSKFHWALREICDWILLEQIERSMKKAKLTIDGTEPIEGVGIGASGVFAGELVFSTAMSSYSEALTDQSYAGEILLFTYPLIGNYGISRKWFESKKFQPKALICGEISGYYSHFEASMGLEQFMQEQNVGGIAGVDTRFLVKLIRKLGTVHAALIVD